jgi:hypothetical protein
MRREDREDRVNTTTCKGCGAKIIWTCTEKNSRAMPVDAEPRAGGNIRLVDDGHNIISIVEAPKPDSVAYYVSHFVTCPKRDQFRKAKK